MSGLDRIGPAPAERTHLQCRLPVYRDFVVEIVHKISDPKGFEVLPRRQAVERSSGWRMCRRLLSRTCEHRCDVSEVMIDVGMGALLFRRIAHP